MSEYDDFAGMKPHIIYVGPEEWDEIQAILDAPPKPAEELNKIFAAERRFERVQEATKAEDDTKSSS